MVLRPGYEERTWKTFWRCVYKANKREHNLSWKDYHTLNDIYGNITPISRRLASRRHRFVSHCFRDKSQIISDLILWKLPSYRKRKGPLNYIDAVSRDTNIGYEELPTAMSDRTYWKNFVVNTHAEAEGSKTSMCALRCYHLKK